jgi:RimJ/RimL family protein N-acetyltransferase
MELQPPDPPLRDEVIELRVWSPDDVPAVVAACRDPEVPRWTTVPSPYTEEDARGWIELATTSWKEGTAPFAIVDRETNDLAGALTLWAHGRAIGELGYWSVAAFRGRGYMPRAIRLICRWGFEEVGLARIQLGTLLGNVSSERVAEKCGFQREGILRSWIEQRGERREVTMWSLLPGELK